MIDTVAETMAHGRMRPALARAPASALDTVGSPPLMRSLAAEIKAALKKMVM
jgi:hypothetical protein